MVAGYHLIWTAYGWWLPNDPRGSSSHEIRVERIAELGELHHGRKSQQPSSATLREFYGEAEKTLKHPLLKFTDDDVRVVAQNFEETVQTHKYTCYACAIMPDHVHMLIRKHRDQSETIMERLQDGSRVALIDSGSRPSGHPVWGGPGWKVFLSSREDIRRIIKYIELNPVKARRPAQEWGFVKEYDGWLPGNPRNQGR